MLHLIADSLSLGLSGQIVPLAATPTVGTAASVRMSPPIMQQQPQQRLYGAEARRAARDAKNGVVTPTTAAARAAQSPLANGPRPRPPPPMDGPPPPQLVQGQSLRTYNTAPIKDHHVTLGTDGRPMSGSVELWDGPGNTPVKMEVYGDDGYARPVRAVIRGAGRPNTVALRNTGPMEFPVAGSVQPTAPPVDPAGNAADGPTAECFDSQKRIQGGGAEQTYIFDWTVESVQIFITSEGMPVSCEIEVLQGPNTVRQGIRLYSDDGRGKPVFYLLDTPGPGCVVQITNTGPMEYPVSAACVPHTINTSPPDIDPRPVLGGETFQRRRGRYDMPPGQPYNGGAGRDYGAHWSQQDPRRY